MFLERAAAFVRDERMMPQIQCKSELGKMRRSPLGD
jgi:hypothetical protein